LFVGIPHHDVISNKLSNTMFSSIQRNRTVTLTSPQANCRKDYQAPGSLSSNKSSNTTFSSTQ
jgi:hypothetical protein